MGEIAKNAAKKCQKITKKCKNLPRNNQRVHFLNFYIFLSIMSMISNHANEMKIQNRENTLGTFQRTTVEQ